MDVVQKDSLPGRQKVTDGLSLWRAFDRSEVCHFRRVQTAPLLHYLSCQSTVVARRVKLLHENDRAMSESTSPTNTLGAPMALKQSAVSANPRGA